MISIDLDELIAETDVPSENTCCDNVDVLYKDETKDGVYCFRVDAPR